MIHITEVHRSLQELTVSHRISGSLDQKSKFQLESPFDSKRKILALQL